MTRVLVVDDRDENVYYLRALLSANGYEVETAHHGVEALAKARPAPPDIVISDLLMPVMDGYRLLREWKADPQLKGVPFVVYTATYTEPEDEQLALHLGADAFVLKPTEPEVFLSRLREVEANARAATRVTPHEPIADEGGLLREYSQALVRKLEEKMLELEATNRSLEQDIEERKRAEAALRISEQRFRLLTEAMPQLVWCTRPDGTNMLVNRRWVEYTGLSPDASVGDGWRAAYHPDDRVTSDAAWAQARARGEPYAEEARLRGADGSYRWWLLRALPLHDDAGAITSWLGTCTDIDDLKHALQARDRAERDASERAAVLDAVFAAVPDVVALLNLEGHVRFANRALAPDEPLSASWLRSLDDALSGGKPTSFEWAAREPQGETKVYWTTIAPVSRAGQISGAVLVARDVTERKRLEEQVLRTQRMESLGALAGGIAHDLNNILAPILVCSAFLKMDEARPERLESVGIIESCAQRGASLIQQLLSFARGAEVTRRPLDVRHLAREMQVVARDTFPKNIEVQLTAAPDLWPVLGDATQISQVLMNLCVNARDAMPHGGKITLSLENFVVDDAYAATIPDAKPGPYVILRAEDTGIGMPPKVLERIFEPFFTTKEQGKGTGLGLSTTQAIVRGHGGFIRVRSELGKGTTFEILLPADGTAAVDAGAGTSLREAPRGPLRDSVQ
jgi:PAS domain S-box-containing protein